MPPLLLEDDEAVAVAIGLRTATSGAVTGIEETLAPGAREARAGPAAAAAAPGRDRSRASRCRSARYGRTPTVDPEVLTRARAARPRAVHGPVRLLRPQADVVPAARRAVPDRATPASAGTSWRGTWTATTGGRSASTGCGPGCRRDRGSRRARSPTRRSRRWSRAASRPRRAGTRLGSSSTCRRTGCRSAWGRGSGTVEPLDDERSMLDDRRRADRGPRGPPRPARRGLPVTEPPELVAPAAGAGGALRRSRGLVVLVPAAVRVPRVFERLGGRHPAFSRAAVDEAVRPRLRSEPPGVAALVVAAPRRMRAASHRARRMLLRRSDRWRARR